MEALELDLEPTGYNALASFDGRVLELFSQNADDSRRIHIKFLSISVSDEKKGRRNVVLNNERGTSSVTRFATFINLDASAFEAIRPLLDALTNAGVRVTG